MTGGRPSEAHASSSAFPVLDSNSIGMRFGGLRALIDVDLALDRGQWLGLIGPNGSGKTTLLNVLSGIYRASSGVVRLGGVDVTRESAAAVAKRGLVRTFQHPQLAETLTVRENVLLGADLAQRSGCVLFDVDAAVYSHLDLFGCTRFSEWLPSTVPFGVRKMAELARAVLANPLVLLLDEPAAGLSREERSGLVKALRAVRDMRPEMAVCLVEHDVSLVAALCTEMQALNFGKVLARGPSAKVLMNSDVRVSYLGRAYEDVGSRRASTSRGGSTL